jgi:ATP-binding protein involved in chromosome partitioning
MTAAFIKMAERVAQQVAISNAKAMSAENIVNN